MVLACVPKGTVIAAYYIRLLNLTGALLGVTSECYKLPVTRVGFVWFLFQYATIILHGVPLLPSHLYLCISTRAILLEKEAPQRGAAADSSQNAAEHRLIVSCRLDAMIMHTSHD